MKWALKRQEDGKMRVIPIILRNFDWTKAPFAELQILPKDGRPVVMWEPQDSAWRDVAEGIRKVVEEIRKGRSSPIPQVFDPTPEGLD